MHVQLDRQTDGLNLRRYVAPLLSPKGGYKKHTWEGEVALCHDSSDIEKSGHSLNVEMMNIMPVYGTTFTIKAILRNVETRSLSQVIRNRIGRYH